MSEIEESGAAVDLTKEIEKRVRDNFDLAFEKSLGEIEPQEDDIEKDPNDRAKIKKLTNVW